jgi:hypothetical protein
LVICREKGISYLEEDNNDLLNVNNEVNNEVNDDSDIVENKEKTIDEFDCIEMENYCYKYN